MLSFNRRFFLLGAAALGGCGFTPVLGTQGSANRLQNNILVDAPKDRPGFLLTSELEDRLGRATTPRYGLSYKIELSEAPFAISTNDVSLGFDLLGEITYQLRDLGTGEVVSKGMVENFTSYSASGSTVATQVAERDANTRLMTILADQIVTRLYVAANGLPA